MTAMSKEHVYNDATDVLTKLFGWDLLWGEVGVRPDVGFYKEEFEENTRRFRLRGKAYACGVRFLFVGWKGDTKSRKMTHRFCERYWRTNYCCEECLVSKQDKTGSESHADRT
jgi:hypothetical protein